MHLCVFRGCDNTVGSAVAADRYVDRSALIVYYRKMYSDTCRACGDNYCGDRCGIAFYLRFLSLCNSLLRPFFFCSSVAFTSSNACLIVILFNAPFITEDISQPLPRFLQSCADRRRAYVQHLSYFFARVSVIIEQIHRYFQLVGQF